MPSDRTSHDGCALVTGGNRGIGAAIAQRLRDDGWKVATIARTGGDFQADVSDSAAVEEAFDAGPREFGPVIVLVNNAGIRRDGLAIRMTAEDWSVGCRRQPRRRLSTARGTPCSDMLSAPLGADRQHQLRRRRAREPRPGQLRGLEGRAARPDAHDRTGDGPQGHHLQRCDPRSDRDRDDRGHRHGRCSAAYPRRRPDNLRRSLRRSHSCAAKRPRTSTEPSWR